MTSRERPIASPPPSSLPISAWAASDNGTVGWLSLSIIASAFVLFRASDRRLTLALAVLVPVYVLAFYTGKRFPAKYQGGLFSAQHGSWNRTTPIGAPWFELRLAPERDGRIDLDALRSFADPLERAVLPQDDDILQAARSLLAY